MALSRRSRILLSSVFITLTYFTASLLGVRAFALPESVRITAVANLTLRTTPSSTAPAVAQLPLGTEVVESGPDGLDKTWVRVKLADAREGWLQTNRTRLLDPAWRWPVFDQIINDRLGRKGDGFLASAELVSFIERVAPEYSDPDGRARLELARLRALSRAAATFPTAGAKTEPYASWLAARKSDLVFDEPGGAWILRDTAIWDAHAKQRSTAAADDIAWLAVTTGLPGECSGDVSCYVYAINRRYGEYLRQHPVGRRVDEAVGVVNKTVESVVPSGKLNPSVRFVRADCTQMVPAVDGLTAAVQATAALGRDSALGGLAGLRKLCQ